LKRRCGCVLGRREALFHLFVDLLCYIFSFRRGYQAQSSEVTDSLGNAFNRAATLKQMFDNWDGELPADLQKVYRNLSSAMNQIAEAKQTAYNVEMKLRRYR